LTDNSGNEVAPVRIVEKLRNFIKIFFVFGFSAVHFGSASNRKVFRDLLVNDEVSWWLSSRMPLPAPQAIKIEFITRYSNPDTTWIETGTYLGTTTEALAKISKWVISIEPSEELYNKSLRRLSAFNNVQLLNGSSEDLFNSVCTQVSGSVSFWLDGHFSGGETFKGEQDCPIEYELAAISQHLPIYERVCVYIDDFRLFRDTREQNSDYPLKSFLVNWAEQNGLEWSVNSDIFFARSRD
jgi:hypothetical protein